MTLKSRNMMAWLILLSFLIGFIAPACGFSWGGKYSVIEICTTQGIESRIVENNNNQGDHEQTTEQCQFCFQNAHLKDYFLPPSTFIDDFQALQRVQVNQYYSALLNRVYSPQNPRGPPSFI